LAKSPEQHGNPVPRKKVGVQKEERDPVSFRERGRRKVIEKPQAKGDKQEEKRTRRQAFRATGVSPGPEEETPA